MKIAIKLWYKNSPSVIIQSITGNYFAYSTKETSSSPCFQMAKIEGNWNDVQATEHIKVIINKPYFMRASLEWFKGKAAFEKLMIGNCQVIVLTNYLQNLL